MKTLAVALLLSLPVWAAESGGLFLRGRVPAVYHVKVSSLGEITAYSNGADLVLPQVTVEEKTNSKLVTVTHP